MLYISQSGKHSISKLSIVEDNSALDYTFG